jgi:4-amino-4-deoxy-L-arabinose transferase-like glycosyltransferase
MDKNSGSLQAHPKAETVLLLAIAAAVTLIHLLTNGRYGFHRDELQFLSDARHLDWGFVAYPPLTPFVEHIGLELFGLSMVGLRLFSVLAQAAAIVVTGLMARELGGGRLAQGTAALAVALSPLPLFNVWHGVSVHNLRLPVVGAGCILRDPAA